MKERTQVLLGLGGGLAGGIAIAATHNPSLLSAADSVAAVGALCVNASRATVQQLVLFPLLFARAVAKCPTVARTTLLGFFDAVSQAMLVLVRWVVRLAPIGVFGLMLPLGAHGGVGLAGAVGFYIIAYSAASVLFVLLLYPALAIVARVPVKLFAHAALPAQLIAFSTSSSIASLPALVEGAEQKLKLPKEITGFVLPLAVSMFKFAGPVAWPLG